VHGRIAVEEGASQRGTEGGTRSCMGSSRKSEAARMRKETGQPQEESRGNVQLLRRRRLHAAKVHADCVLHHIAVRDHTGGNTT
jgi:hypothetical protein